MRLEVQGEGDLGKRHVYGFMKMNTKCEHWHITCYCYCRRGPQPPSGEDSLPVNINQFLSSDIAVLAKWIHAYYNYGGRNRDYVLTQALAPSHQGCPHYCCCYMSDLTETKTKARFKWVTCFK